MTKEINTKILGGWLILVQAYIIFNLVVWLKDLNLFWGLLKEKDKMLEALGSNPNIGLYTTFIYFEVVVSIVFTLAMFAMFFIFFKKWRVFPKLMISVLTLQIASEAFSYFYFGPISGYQESLLQKLVFSAFVALILIGYLVMSKRVKMTFVV